MSRTIEVSAEHPRTGYLSHGALLLGIVLVLLTVSVTAARAGSPGCESDGFAEPPQGPWVAVVDWDDDHGRSIGEIIRQASGDTVGTRLFALADRDASERLPTANDKLVLAQLRRVAAAAQCHAPLAVNLSFGRLDTRPAGPEKAPAMKIAEVLRYLRHGLGIPVFAAAGHQGQLLYPAADPSVTAVGALDLSHLAATGQARPLSGTPLGIGALLPGQGLYLEEGGTSRVRPVPPGSSYASALAAGWWAAYRAASPRLAAKLFDFCRHVLSPRPRPGGRFALACGSTTLPGSAFEAPAALVSTALGERPEVCSSMARDTAETRILDVVELATDVPRRTLADVRPELSHPMPESRPCVPCHGSGGGGDNSSGGEVWWPPTGGKTDTELSVDLSASRGIGPELELLGLYLEVGGRLLRFSDSENRTLLGEIALGRIDQLTLRDVPDSIGAGGALVYALRFADGGPTFRSSSPILVHNH